MLTLLLTAIVGTAQCGPGGCPIPGTAAPPLVTLKTTTPIEIELIPPTGTLTINGHPITLTNGTAVVEAPPLPPGQYRYDLTARWGTIERTTTLTFTAGQPVKMTLRRDAPPSAPPTSQKQPQLPEAEAQPINYGIDLTHLNPDQSEKFSIGSQTISRPEAIALLTQTLEDDSKKPRLTIIGTDEERRRVIADLNGPLSDLTRSFLIQDYPPDHWAVTSAGFYNRGHPTIYVQTPEGTVLHRQDDYGGPEELRPILEKLRRPDPDYDPAKDPDLRRPARGLLGRLADNLAAFTRSLWGLLLTAAAIAVLVLAALRGWLAYLLWFLYNLIPTPPAVTTPAATPAAKEKTRSKQRTATKRKTQK